MKKRKLILCGITIMLFLAYSLFLANYAANKTEDKIVSTETTKAELVDIIMYSESAEEIESKLTEAFKKMEKEDSTEVIDTLIYFTSQDAAQNTITDEENEKLFAAVVDGRVDINKVTDEPLSSKLSLLKQNHIIPRYTNESIFYDIDYQYFLDTYKEFLIPAYYDVLEFYFDEKENDYYIPSESKLLTQVVEQRLNTLYGLMKSYKDSDVYPLVEAAYVFYKTEYLGAYDESLIYESNTIKEEVLDSYRKFKDETKDKELKTLLDSLITDYETSNRVRTVYMREIIQVACGITEESTPSNANAISN